MKSIWVKLAGCVLPIALLATGCTGVNTFTTAARPGETVALAVGWQKHLQRQNLTVTITDATGATVTYPPNDNRVRSIINMYPDPVSKAVVGTETGQTLGVNANAAGSLINDSATYGDPDWWQTSLLLDLPTLMQLPVNNQPIATGPATITLNDSAGAVIYPINVEILSGTSARNTFAVTVGENFLNQGYNLKTFERADHYTVTFNTYKDTNNLDVIPHSIQAVFTHTAGVGVPWVVNPRGDLKSILWTDDGVNLKVMITPVKGQTLSAIIKEKFYIAGGIAGLTLTSFKAYDVNGVLLAGITPSIQ